MPNRIVRESILASEAVCSLGWPEEVFYRRLMSIVDDYGRCEANAQLLRARCYPLQTDQVRVADITRWMAACQKSGLILLYEIAGKGYLEVQKFGQQQRSASKCPPPPVECSGLLSVDSNCNQALPVAQVGVGVGVSEVVNQSQASAIYEPAAVIPATEVCARLIRDGFNPTALNPQNPKLLALLDAGLTVDEIASVGPEAVQKGKGFAWLLATAEGRRRDAAATKTLPPRAEKPWFMSSSGIEAKAVEHGIERKRDETFPAFKARVYQAAGVTDEMVRRAKIDAGAPA
ncbi:MAG: hypothetical protein ABFC67_14795 [Mizugakiibacter sp.]|uniref:hypothetical protein n=1 Tax=Mizugakiibacter sp. TaxID=1972610 RepID=UPI00320F5C7B